MSSSPAAACLYSARVMHRRYFGAAYAFRYRVFSLLLDIDRIDEAVAASPLFSRNRFNLVGFHDADHLPPGAAGLRPWAEGVLAAAGIDGRGLKISLLCFPRILGRVFNPLSLWYCEQPDGRPAAVIAEVRNTFGERHCYLLQPQSPGADWPLVAEHAKDFHVSPFIGMGARYAFRLPRPDARLRVAIRETMDGRLLLVATQSGERLELTTANLLMQLARVPLQTLKVLGAIHWQALKIWLKGARFHRKPPPPIQEVT